MITTTREDLAEKMSRIVDHGRNDALESIELGTNLHERSFCSDWQSPVKARKVGQSRDKRTRNLSTTLQN